MNELHLFAGAGGGILGGMLLGHTTVCAVERNQYRRKLLLQRQRDGILPKFPIWDDVRTFSAKPWRDRIDAVCGGFPCQRFSKAARGRNTAEDLWPEMLRVVCEAEPAIVFAENVSDRAIECAAEDLRSVGYKTKAVALSAADLGADHIRPRYWLLGDANGDGESRLAINDEASRLPEFGPRVWENYGGSLRVFNGMASTMDRTRAAGDGQVPIVAALAWRTLTQS